MQIFVSYARNDDLPPLESSDAKGFVTALYGYLNYQFKALGPPAPELWRDTRSIGRSDQFDPIIEAAAGSSDLFLVVLSRNWLSREFCLKELELFRKRWAAEGEAGIKRRIIVVAKQHVEFDDRPPLLRGQEGYWFYRRDADEGIGVEQEFFSGGKPQGEYYDLVKRLAVDLWRRAQPETPTPGKPSGAGAKPAKSEDVRTVYLAKPAADMRAAYLRLVDELEQRGYRVVPERDAEIPYDDGAANFVLGELAKAEASIHVLGEKSGYTPEDGEPIVKLQLQLAAARSAEAPAAGGVPFRRIVWAPRVLVDEQGGASAVERDPLAVLARFDKQVESDKIEGSELSKFAEFVIQHLDRTARLPEAPLAFEDVTSDARRLYVYYRPEDRKLAMDFGKLLQEHEIEPVWPAFEGDPAQIRSYHREKLQECDAVVLCWGAAADLWVKASAHELRNWRELGREKRFDLRGLLAGPPPGEFKDVLMELPPRSEIDVVLDLTKDEALTHETVQPLLARTRGGPESTAAAS